MTAYCTVLSVICITNMFSLSNSNLLPEHFVNIFLITLTMSFADNCCLCRSYVPEAKDHLLNSVAPVLGSNLCIVGVQRVLKLIVEFPSQ